VPDKAALALRLWRQAQAVVFAHLKLDRLGTGLCDSAAPKLRLDCNLRYMLNKIAQQAFAQHKKLGCLCVMSCCFSQSNR